LRVRGCIGAAAGQWDDMVDDVAVPAVRIAGRAHERVPGGLAAAYAAVMVARTARAARPGRRDE